jgi:predicted aspartyl protease
MERLIIRNTWDVIAEAEGKLEASKVRTVEVEALVDTGAHMCGLHRSHIEELGLTRFQEVPVYTGNGVRKTRVFSPGPEFELLGRKTFLDVMELDDQTPPIIGVVLLELLLLTVDPVNRRVIPHPRQQYFMLCQNHDSGAA